MSEHLPDKFFPDDKLVPVEVMLEKLAVIKMPCGGNADIPCNLYSTSVWSSQLSQNQVKTYRNHSTEPMSPDATFAGICALPVLVQTYDVGSLQGL